MVSGGAEAADRAAQRRGGTRLGLSQSAYLAVQHSVSSEEQPPPAGRDTAVQWRQPGHQCQSCSRVSSVLTRGRLEPAQCLHH